MDPPRNGHLQIDQLPSSIIKTFPENEFKGRKDRSSSFSSPSKVQTLPKHSNHYDSEDISPSLTKNISPKESTEGKKGWKTPRMWRHLWKVENSQEENGNSPNIPKKSKDPTPRFKLEFHGLKTNKNDVLSPTNPQSRSFHSFSTAPISPRSSSITTPRSNDKDSPLSSYSSPSPTLPSSVSTPSPSLSFSPTSSIIVPVTSSASFSEPFFQKVSFENNNNNNSNNLQQVFPTTSSPSKSTFSSSPPQIRIPNRESSQNSQHSSPKESMFSSAKSQSEFQRDISPKIGSFEQFSCEIPSSPRSVFRQIQRSRGNNNTTNNSVNNNNTQTNSISRRKSIGEDSNLSHSLKSAFSKLDFKLLTNLDANKLKKNVWETNRLQPWLNFIQLLSDSDLQVSYLLLRSVDLISEKQIAFSLLRVLESKDLIPKLMKRIYHLEVNSCTDHRCLFREQSWTVELTREYFLLFGNSYLVNILKPPIENLIKDSVVLEMDSRGTILASELNKATLTTLSDSILNNIINSVIPKQVLETIDAVASQVNEKFFGQTSGFTKGFQICVANMMFLRWLCPALILPYEYKIILSQNGEPLLNSTTRKILVYVTKMLQTLSSGSNFEPSNDLYFMQYWIDKNRHEYLSWCEKLITQIFTSPSSDISPTAICEDLISIVSYSLTKRETLSSLLDSYPELSQCFFSEAKECSKLKISNGLGFSHRSVTLKSSEIS